MDLTYSTNMPTKMANILGNRIQIPDRNVHHQLKSDLFEHIWQKFGTLYGKSLAHYQVKTKA